MKELIAQRNRRKNMMLAQASGTKGRPYTISRRKMALEMRFDQQDEELQQLMTELQQYRPKTRGQCRGQYKVCPWVSCRYHLFLDVGPNGSIKYNFPDLEVWQLPYSCALDVAENNGELNFAEVGNLVNLTRERIRQCVDSALLKLSRVKTLSSLRLDA